jgi:hypothetical protein
LISHGDVGVSQKRNFSTEFVSPRHARFAAGRGDSASAASCQHCKTTASSSLYKCQIGLLLKPELAELPPGGMFPAAFEGGHDG